MREELLLSLINSNVNGNDHHDYAHDGYDYDFDPDLRFIGYP
jgi:hypothetical protein